MSRRIALLTMVVLALQFLGGTLAPARSADEVSITGAGASFPAPLYKRWAYEYQKETGNQINYNSIGSGGGIAQIKAKTVDFGASDAPMKPEDLKQYGLTQFPMTMGGVVPVVNLEGVTAGQLKLTGDVLARIYLGDIKKWNDDAIAKLNPEMTLPDSDIAVVHRSDGSGTTWIFTNYLSKVSPSWTDKVGSNTTVNWPVGTGGKGNEGVAALVKQVGGSIGYVELAYALQNKMASTQMQNHDGNFVKPTIKAFQAAAANADWEHADSFYVVLTDQPGAKSWPITGASFIIMQKAQDDGGHAMEVLKFFDWAFQNGDKASKALHYVPIPPAVVKLINDSWTANIQADGKPVWKK